MRTWHCGTAHCRAGHALEQQVGPEVAGGLIYAASTGRWPNFFATNEAALEDIRKCAADPTSTKKGG